jgi:hypothetical protein
MSVSDSQKVDLLYKKLFGVAKTDLGTNKGASNESIASPALNRGDKIWLQASSIPATAAALTGIVQAYQTTSRVQCTADNTSTAIGGVYPTWKTGLTDWIPPEFGSTYFVKVYATTSGLSDPTSGGTQLSDAGTGGTGEWFFDYQSGVLNFIGGTIPAALTSSLVVQITGYRYIGNIGINNFSSYANSNVAAYLPTNSADITAGNITANGTIIANSSITSSNGNITVPNGNVTANYLNGIHVGNVYTSNIFSSFNNPNITFSPAANGVIIMNTTTAMQVPVGSNSQYPGTPTTGMIRYNTSLGYIEVYTGSSWTTVGATTNNIITSDIFNADGSANSFVISQNNTTSGTLVTINGVMQIPGSSYTVSGNVLTFNETPVSTDVIEARSFGPASGVSFVNAYANANVAAYLPIYSGNITAGNITTVSGQHIGYHTGAIGANAANTGAFTTVTTTGNITISGNAAITGNTNITGNLTTSGSGYFYGAYNESSVLPGVFIGNTGSSTPSPRIGFYNGTTSQNWQIDNYSGTFRWFTPGVTQMQLDPGGNLSVVNGNVTVAGNVTVSGSAGIIQSNRTGFRVTGGGGTIGLNGNVIASNWTVDYTQGLASSALNGTTGTFVAPIAGLYSTSLTARTSSNSNTGIIQIAIYQKKAGSQSVAAFIEWGPSTSFNHATTSTTVKLAVGDSLWCQVLAIGGSSGVSFDGNDHWDVVYIG